MGRLTEWNKDKTHAQVGHCDAYTKLAQYEDIIDDPEKLKLIDELYLEKCEEINRLKAKLEEYENLGLEAIYGLMNEVTKC